MDELETGSLERNEDTVIDEDDDEETALVARIRRIRPIKSTIAYFSPTFGVGASTGTAGSGFSRTSLPVLTFSELNWYSKYGSSIGSYSIPGVNSIL
jgi:hypothetical protein